MRTDGGSSVGVLARRDLRRHALLTVATSFAVSTAIVVGYFVLPFTSRIASGSFVELAVGLAVVAGLLAWQVRGILHSPVPTIRAIAALAVSLPLFLVLFATTYFLMSRSDPQQFSEPLTRLDAAYFTVTVFATVGFGDITAVSEAARAIVTVQMLSGLVLVGLIARVVVGAVQEARNRRAEGRTE